MLYSALLTSASSRLDLNADVMVQVALGLVQGVDEIYQSVTEPGPCQFVVAVGAALYKVRKLTFVTLMGAAEGWLLPIVLAIVVLEGNSFLRSAENALSYARPTHLCVKRIPCHSDSPVGHPSFAVVLC